MKYYKAINVSHNINGKSLKHHIEGKKSIHIREYTQYDSNYYEKCTSLIYDNRKGIMKTFQEREGVVR